MEHRYLRKFFKCRNCLRRFKKLVQIDDQTTPCESCGGNSQILEENEFNREVADRTYRISFDHSDPEFESQYHPVTDILNRDPSNLYGDPQRRIIHSTTPETRRVNTTQRRVSENNRARNRIAVIPGTIVPYTFSPFRGSVNRHPFQYLLGNFFTSDFFFIPNQEFFMDNYASNFSSNFDDPVTRIVFLQSMQNQPSGNPPASKESLKNLKKFKMTEEFCKKDEKGGLEFPSCSVCLSEIEKNQDTTLVPCGHMFHDYCISKWLNMHNSCPVCRYELPTNSEFEKNTKQRQNGENTSNFNSYTL